MDDDVGRYHWLTGGVLLLSLLHHPRTGLFWSKSIGQQQHVVFVFIGMCARVLHVHAFGQPRSVSNYQFEHGDSSPRGVLTERQSAHAVARSRYSDTLPNRSGSIVTFYGALTKRQMYRIANPTSPVRLRGAPPNFCIRVSTPVDAFISHHAPVV